MDQDSLAEVGVASAFEAEEDSVSGGSDAEALIPPRVQRMSPAMQNSPNDTSDDVWRRDSQFANLEEFEAMKNQGSWRQSSSRCRQRSPHGNLPIWIAYDCSNHVDCLAKVIISLVSATTLFFKRHNFVCS